MTPTDSTGHTRTDLQAPRAPASPLEVRAKLRDHVRDIAASLRGRTDPGAKHVILLCDNIVRLLSAVSIAERERDDARRAQRFADGRVAFTDRGVLELQRIVEDQRADLAEAQALLELARSSVAQLQARLQTEGFDVQTADGQPSVPIAHEPPDAEEGFDVPTTVRRGDL